MSADVLVPGLPALDWALSPGRAYVTQSSLFLEADGSADWTLPVYSPSEGDAARLTARPLGFRAPGSFALTAKASISGARSAGDAPALLVWRSTALRSSWAKLGFERRPGTQGGGCAPTTTVVRSGAADIAWHDNPCPSSPAASPTTRDESISTGSSCWLRVCRSGPTFMFLTSHDGRRWETLRTFSLEGSGEVRAGFIAVCPNGKGCEARFEEIELGQPGHDA